MVTRGGARAIRVNGSEAATGAAAISWVSDTRFGIGAGVAVTADFQNGRIAEVLVLSGQSDEAIVTLEQYLRSKYGI
jgi:hypothetical protein